MIAVHVRVSGRVQGVFYRAFTRDRALALGVKGWVRNIPSGGVEAVLEGERKPVGELLKAMKSGPVGRHNPGDGVLRAGRQRIRGF